MPGIEADRPGIVPTDVIGRIGSVPFETPASRDMTAAVRSGFITASDISRRLREKVSENDALKTQLATSDFQRKRLAEQEAMAPEAFEIAKRTQALAGDQLTLSEREMEDQLALFDPMKRAEVLNRRQAQAVEQAFTENVGPLPETFEISAPAKVEDYPTWVNANLEKIFNEATSMQTGFLPNSPEDLAARAKFANEREAAFLKEAPGRYQEYVKVAKERKIQVPRGTPEYVAQAQKELTKRLQQAAVQGAQLKALPGVLETKAKTDAAAAAKVGEGRNVYREQLNLGTVEDIEKTIGVIEGFSSGVLPAIGRAAMAQIPATEAKDFEANLESLKAKIGFAQLAEMREASKTGGALGQMAVKESEWLQNSINALNPRMSPQELIHNLKTIKDRLIRWEEAKRSAAGGAPAPTTPSTGATDYESLVGKRVTLKDGRSGVVTKNPDGTYSLK